jgi:hypothetical protein
MGKIVASVSGADSEGILAQSGSFPVGVHFVDLNTVQNGVRACLHLNVFSGGGDVQLVISTNASTWTSYDPETELLASSDTLPALFTMMGFDIPASARYVGIRNTAPMDAVLLLWAVGI